MPEGHDVSLIELQAQLAAKRSREDGFARLVWISPGLEIADERQRKVVEALRNDPELGPRDSVLETSLDELKNEIEDQLRAPAAEEAAGTLMLSPPGEVPDPERLVARLVERRVSVMGAAPSLLAHLNEVKEQPP